ncbi:hypothetical protein C6499_22720 [Candidatus Poribacteria bacterium]|nr:MAG: hypothetical protein C6499_22720 [Candidatus Poribacteria bacterium]
MANLLTESIEIYRDDYIKVLCMDEQGAGGAHHLYHIYEVDADVATVEPLTVIKHQEGAILENGVNGCTNEALLAICGHRMECFQKGPFPSHYNANAKIGIDFGKANLEARTRDRKARNVEGQTKA